MSVGTSYEILSAQDDNGPQGVIWEGDADNEIIFGTFWNDFLYGDDGEDVLYGFEGDDRISGGRIGKDRIFGDGGNDILWGGNVSNLGDVSISNPDGT